MSGFSFSLRSNKVTKGPKNKAGILSKKIPPKKNALFNDEEASTDAVTAIDAFHATKGAMSGTKAISATPDLVIEPVNRSHRLKHTAPIGADQFTEKTETKALSLDERARISLLRGDQPKEPDSKTISQNSEEVDAEATADDYESVPVDQFGAALLRGMGWSGESESQNSASKDVSHRQRGVVLGIGAKSIEKDLETELLSKKNLSAPLLRRER